MRIALCLDELFLKHQAPPGHPERPERLRSIARSLERTSATGVFRLPVRPADRSELETVHAPSFVESLGAQVKGRSGYLDPDTYYSPQSWDAALAAAGVAIDSARLILGGEVDGAAAFVRPPGHHAESARAMGFCLLNNVAIAAAAARADGAQRVAIVDWDVHHGNGTQEIFWRDPNVLYFSVHQYPFYPGTGSNGEIGEGPGRGTTINVPLPAEMGQPEYEYVFDQVLLPALRAFAPTLIIVSAGYDAHRADPLAQMSLETRSYHALTLALRTLGIPLLVVLEGGYDLDAVGESALATVEALAVAHPQIAKHRDCADAARESCVRTSAALGGTPIGLAVAAALEEARAFRQ